jgi:hypothetical protein
VVRGPRLDMLEDDKANLVSAYHFSPSAERRLCEMKSDGKCVGEFFSSNRTQM